MIKEVRNEIRIRLKMAVLENTQLSWNTALFFRQFEMPRSSVYKWEKAFGIEARSN